MVFCFVQNFFFRTTRELEYLFFLSRKAQFFFQNLTLGYMTKTLNQIFFSLHQNQNIFFSNIGNQNIFFRKKTITPPLQVKWSFPKEQKVVVDLSDNWRTWPNIFNYAFRDRAQSRYMYEMSFRSC